MSAPVLSREAVVTPCYGRPERFEWSSLDGKRWIDRRALALGLCHGCPLLGGECARRALDQPDMSGMVWDGVPVPPRNKADYRRARRVLQAIAGVRDE